MSVVMPQVPFAANRRRVAAKGAGSIAIGRGQGGGDVVADGEGSFACGGDFTGTVITGNRQTGSGNTICVTGKSRISGQRQTGKGHQIVASGSAVVTDNKAILGSNSEAVIDDFKIETTNEDTYLTIGARVFTNGRTLDGLTYADYRKRTPTAPIIIGPGWPEQLNYGDTAPKWPWLNRLLKLLRLV